MFLKFSSLYFKMLFGALQFNRVNQDINVIQYDYMNLEKICYMVSVYGFMPMLMFVPCGN